MNLRELFIKFVQLPLPLFLVQSVLAFSVGVTNATIIALLALALAVAAQAARMAVRGVRRARA